MVPGFNSNPLEYEIGKYEICFTLKDEISNLIEYIIKGIKKLLYTENNIYLISHAATGLWEMGLRNSVDKGVLHCDNGAFSSKWAKVSQACGYKNKIIEYEWGNGVKVDHIDRELSTGEYNVLAMVHNETSTGTMSNLEDISNLLSSKYPDVIWLVDAVSSMAGVKVEVDKLGIDSEKWTGFAAGLGVERFCMVRHQIDDIRKFYTNDIRFLEQF